MATTSTDKIIVLSTMQQQLEHITISKGCQPAKYQLMSEIQRGHAGLTVSHSYSTFYLKQTKKKTQIFTYFGIATMINMYILSTAEYQFAMWNINYISKPPYLGNFI